MGTTTALFSQEKGLVRVGTNVGLLFPNSGVGIGADLDLRYNITSNFNVGYKFMGVGLVKAIGYNGEGSGISASTTAALIAADYYFNSGKSYFAPFIGGGFGTFYLSNVAYPSETEAEAAAGLKIVPDMTPGGLLRGGFEFGKIRLTAEYYFLPDSYVIDINKKNIATIVNQCSNISLGFYFGGGSWKKKTKKSADKASPNK